MVGYTLEFSLMHKAHSHRTGHKDVDSNGLKHDGFRRKNREGMVYANRLTALV
jgi:hypothetical protein